MSDIPIISRPFYVLDLQDKRPYLIGSRCCACGYISFPQRVICVKCVKDDTMKQIKIGPYGTLETFAVMQVAPPGFIAPYIIGYVKLREGPLVFTLITDCEPREDALEIGQEMELVIEKIKEDERGNNLIGWKFRPVRKGK